MPQLFNKPSSVDQVCGRLAEIAPLKLAEDWDNVGLLVGDRRATVQRMMTCLTITPMVADEAIEQRIDLLVTHHPLPFKPLARITSDAIAGRILLKLIEGKVAVYSAHTAFDTAVEGINDTWSAALNLQEVSSLMEPNATAMTLKSGSVGAGRYGNLAQQTVLSELAVKTGRFVNATLVQIVGETNQNVLRVAIACGSGGSFLRAASKVGCEALVTGEATFHTCLEAQALGIGLILTGHYASERFAMVHLAEKLAAHFPLISVVASAADTDPMQFIHCHDLT